MAADQIKYIDELVQQREYKNAPAGKDHVDWYPLTDTLYRSVGLTDDNPCSGANGGSSESWRFRRAAS
jgi:hypothetical protein